MIKVILGTKLTQDQDFTSEGKRIPITHIMAGPCTIIQVKKVEQDGYNAIQLGFGSRKLSTSPKPLLGKLKETGLEKNPPRFLTEVKVDKPFNVGHIIKVSDVFKVGDRIQVTGFSKGKGFQGVVKRHHFKGGPRTHGQSDRERAPGSIGQTTTPGRVYKGKRMAGRMGQEKITVKNLKIVRIDEAKNLMTIGGLVPGGRNSFLLIKKLS